MISEILKKIKLASESQQVRIETIFYFVRDAILFDLVDSFLSPEEVVKIGRGACMNKALLLVTLAREVGISARLRFVWVSREALKDLLHPIIYPFWPSPFLHTFPEVKLKGKWVSMEATFDKGLHEVLLTKRLNFARHPERTGISIEFSPDGVVGAQQFCEANGFDPIYAQDLAPLREHVASLPRFKQTLQPLVLRISSRRLNQKIRPGLTKRS